MPHFIFRLPYWPLSGPTFANGRGGHPRQNRLAIVYFCRRCWSAGWLKARPALQRSHSSATCRTSDWRGLGKTTRADA
jgi:hypothetical protein